jgi:Caspase domain
MIITSRLVFCFAMCALVACAQAPKRFALVVGIDKYRFTDAFKQLEGAEKDALAIQDLLIRKYEFPPAGIEMLVNEQATREGILTALQRLVDRTGNGDEVVFYYAGHGSRAPLAGGAANTGQPTIVPVDSRDPGGKVFDILASELQQKINLLKAKTGRITAILDSCHSGTALRGAESHGRSLPPDTRPRQAAPAMRGAAVPVPQEIGDIARNSGIVAITGALPDQEAHEQEVAGAMRGAMTYRLVTELNAALPGETWRSVMDRVEVMVNAKFPSQSPRLETNRPETLVFGGLGVPTDPSFLISDEKDASGVTGPAIRGGSLHGLTVGSVFEVYPPATRKFDAGNGRRVTLSAVAPSLSWLQVEPGVKFAPGSRAVERVRAFADAKLSVDWGAPNASPVIEAVRSALSTDKRYVTKTPGAQMTVRFAAGKIETRHADGTPFGEPIDPNAPGATDILKERLSAFAKWTRQLDLENPGTKGLVIARYVNPRTMLNGDCFRVSLKHSFPKKMYFKLLVFDVDTGAIADIPIAAVQGQEKEVQPGEQAFFAGRAVTDGKPESRSLLKLFATDIPVDMTPAAQGKVRAGVNPLQDMLAEGTTRGGGVEVSTWGTALLPLTVKATPSGNPTNAYGKCDAE